MGAIVLTDFQIGGKSNLSRADIDKLCNVLNISDPQGKLPTGRRVRYALVLQTKAKVPSQEKAKKKKKR